jgi:hypothetical protein
LERSNVSGGATVAPIFGFPAGCIAKPFRISKAWHILFLRVASRSAPRKCKREEVITMLGTEYESTDERLSTREYTEKALREAVMVTRDAIREASTERNGYLFEEYVRFLDSLTGNLARLSELLLVIEADKKMPIIYRRQYFPRQDAPSASITR